MRFFFIALAAQDGRGGHVVGEDGPPVAVALVAGQDDGPLLVTFAHQRERVGGGEAVQAEVAYFIQDKQFGVWV